ncbi:hypothetical protein Clacol_009815 [Clathrus columnatus]|uniref:Uncharacterized protein n=1 Tax=Clathrus columnatus TaxID=1419009 RepID=A0AAV5AP38_9AGAM|nr:hypothetical protein Clacol_009815 [Clathrus columnatus]
MPGIALDKVETLLYGGYAVLFGICVHILAFGSRKDLDAGKKLLVTAIIMFSLSSIHVCVDLVRAIDAFIASVDKPGGASGYYAQIRIWLNVAKQALYATNNILADGLVIYRCYIVWGYNWKVIIVPVIMLIATTVSAYIAVYNFSQVRSGENVFAGSIAAWGTALFSLTLATNILVTSLIAGRIWWVSRGHRNHIGRRHMQKYTQAVAIMYVANNSALSLIAYDALAQIVGIVPTLIIVRVGLGLTKQDATTLNTSARGSTLPHFYRPRRTSMLLEVHKVIQINTDMDTTSGSSTTRDAVEENKHHNVEP